MGGETAKRTVKRWWTRDKAGPVRVAAAAAAAAAGAAAVVGGGADSAEAALRAMRLAQQRAGHLASMASRDRVLKAELERVAPLASQYEGQTSVLATKIAAAAAGVGGQWDDGADPEGMQTMQATGGRFVRPEGMTTGALDYWTGGAAGQVRHGHCLSLVSPLPLFALRRCFPVVGVSRAPRRGSSRARQRSTCSTHGSSLS